VRGFREIVGRIGRVSQNKKGPRGNPGPWDWTDYFFWKRDPLDLNLIPRGWVEAGSMQVSVM
jgi:hypothetical protein